MKWWGEIKERSRQLIDNFCWEMGLDLGSSHTLVYVKDNGVVVEEPTILARRKKRRQKQAVDRKSVV